MTITVNGLESYIGFTASWLLTLAVVGIIGIFLSVLWQSHALIKIEDDCYTYERNIDSLGSVCKFNHKTTISDLLSEGRKGIATITKIEYIPTQIFAGKLTEWNGLKVVQRRPNFKVQYKFNPPDVRREEDIIHSFVTHIEPEGHYAVGDPLPILYRIEDKFFHDEVTSMPFPMPIEDIVNMRDVADLSMSKDTRQETSHGAVNDNTFEDFIHDIQTAKNGWNLTELNRLIQDADPETLCSKKDISIQTLQSILLDDNYKAVHESCVSALFTIAFPYDRRSKKPYLEAIDPIMSYLAATPRDFNHPTIDVIEKIMNCIENRYQSSQWKGMVALPDRFWLLLLDIIHDKAAAPSLVKLLSDRYLQLAPDHYFENFKNEIVLSQSNRSFLRYSEDGSIRMVGWNQ